MIWIFTLPFALVGLLTSCAANQKLLANQSEAQAFLARAATAYGIQPPPLKVESSLPVAGTFGYTVDGAISIKKEALGWETTRLHRLLAHEFGHVLMNNYWNGTTQAIEIDTDVKGVEILMRADGLSERHAFEQFYWDYGGRVAMQGKRPANRPGHASACHELAAFVARFPEQATWARTCPEP
jgi:hypothetical protein